MLPRGRTNACAVTECNRCPEVGVRCGHLGEDVILIVSEKIDWFTIRGPREGLVTARNNRAEADVEFERREEALLA